MKIRTILSSLLINSLLSLANAEKFNVIALPSEYGGNGVGVVIDDGAPIVMTPSVNGMYWSAEAKKPSTDFYYVILNEGNLVYSEKENSKFSRGWSGKSSSTLNQVFGRRYDKAGKLLKTIPRVSPALKSYTKFSKLFQEGEIPVIRFHMTNDDYQLFTTDTGEYREKEYVGSLDVFTPDEVLQYTNVTLSLSGMGSRGFQKRPFKISLSEGDNDSKSNTEIYNRSSFKLRSLVYDSSYIKNKMAVDLACSLGLPVGQASHARFYINNVPFGLYDFTEVIKKSFIRHTFHPDEKKKDVKYGSLYKGVSTEANGLKYQAFLYNDYHELFDDLYQISKPVRQGAEPLDDILEFVSWLDTVNENTPESDIRARFNIDVFLKYMGLEYLICQWDGYLQGGNNYYLYVNPKGYSTLYSFDFDLTFGKWCNYENSPFEEFAKSDKVYGNKGVIYSQLYNKILNREPFKSQMKETLDFIVKRLFNIEALEDRVNYFKTFLSDDVMWDISVRPNIPTKSYDALDEEDEIPTYEQYLSLYEYSEPSIDDFGILNWIKNRSELVATQDNIKFDVSFKDGEVGGPIVLNKNGDAKVDGKVTSGSEARYSFTLSLAMIIIMVLFF